MLDDIDCISEDECLQTMPTCQDHVSERVVEQNIDVLVPLSILEVTVAVTEVGSK